MKLNRAAWLNWIVTILISIPFFISAAIKLSGTEEVLKSAADWGIVASQLHVIGWVELVCIIAFIIPKTGVIGTLLLAAYMGGAIATHLEHGLSLLFPIVFESLIWIVAFIRFPELSLRLTKAV